MNRFRNAGAPVDEFPPTKDDELDQMIAYHLLHPRDPEPLFMTGRDFGERYHIDLKIANHWKRKGKVTPVGIRVWPNTPWRAYLYRTSDLVAALPVRVPYGTSDRKPQGMTIRKLRPKCPSCGQTIKPKRDRNQSKPTNVSRYGAVDNGT